MGVSEHVLRLLVPFARCPKRDAAEAQGYRNGRLKCVIGRASVAALALGLSNGTAAIATFDGRVFVLVSVAHGVPC